MTTMQIEQGLSRIAQAGYRVNNFFQRLDGNWQANLRARDTSLTFGWAFARSPDEALLAALAKVSGGAVLPLPPEMSVGRVAKPEPPVDGTRSEIDDLLG